MVQEKAVVYTNQATYTTQKATKVFAVQFSTVCFSRRATFNGCAISM